ncbi:hypothetical protein BCR41DRAFT_369019 [Lobosporangium transversale]|uniref:Uncharacterized protein n=1 Tax=Lobosporangium transversale TaxID=64571 RepID=A0A1Y2GUL0_9FUNG|nr:hypothetical protein BCR41DRAFT_369019 [Lobosporangium transversale]ORZ23920.1 hypothetical protein BCR41DRAFT_369019 [Lobosporangium transversale]|eukprot:XP_021883734.1 hypothetical protein BCR41DRAFT_369019 [Lobosporangium transversale]
MTSTVTESSIGTTIPTSTLAHEDEDTSFNSDSPRVDFTDGCSLIPSPPPSPGPIRTDSIRSSRSGSRPGSGSASGSGSLPAAATSVATSMSTPTTTTTTTIATKAPIAIVINTRRPSQDIGHISVKSASINTSLLEEPKVSLLSTSYPPPRPSRTSIPEEDEEEEEEEEEERGKKSAVADSKTTLLSSSSLLGGRLSSSQLHGTSPPSPLSSRPLVSFDQHFSNQAKVKDYRERDRDRDSSTTPRNNVSSLSNGMSIGGGAHQGMNNDFDASLGGAVKRDSYSNRRQSMATAMGKRPGAAPAAIQEEEE